MVITADADVVAMFGVNDTIRVDAVDTLKYFAEHGWRLGIVSGDNQAAVDRVAAEIGIDPELARGDLLPDEKLAMVQQVAKQATVVMVGDGVNDAAALAAADIGVAIKGGAAASLSAAPVMIGDGQLSRLVLFATAAERTRRSIRRNFAISISYNLLAVALAMTATITPLIAAALMPLSSVTVLALTLSHRTLPEKSL